MSSTWSIVLIACTLAILFTLVRWRKRRGYIAIAAASRASLVRDQAPEVISGLVYWSTCDVAREIQSVEGECRHFTERVAAELTDGNCSITDLVHPDDQQLVARELSKAIAESKSFRFNYRIGRVGAWRWVRDSGTVVLSTHAEPVAIQGHLVDISARVSAELARVRAEERYEMLSKNCQDVISLHDADGKVQFATPSIETVLGYAPSDLLDRTYFVLIHPDDRDEVREKIAKRVQEDGEEIQVSYRVRSKHGTYRSVESLCRPAQDAHGYMTRFVMASRDVTELTKARRELQRLKRQVENSTHLDEVALETMGHELRTPLTGMLGFADLLGNEVEERHRETVKLIQESGERLLATLTSVMDYSMLGSPRDITSTESVDIVALVSQETGRHRRAARKREVRLQFVSDGGKILARIEPEAVTRIADQLIGNAVKFTPKDEVVTVSVHDEENDVLIRVADTGIGISEEFLPHIYEPFRQESTGLSRQYEGVGIGLSIVKRHVEQLGGAICVDSVKGKGSTFSVQIPKRHVRAPDRERRRHKGGNAEEESKTETTLVKHGRLLAVDDNEPMRFILRRHLEEQFDVVTAGNGEETLKLAAADHFDVVLLDMNLGSEKTGEDVLRELRQLPNWADVHVIAVTAYALPEERSRFLEAGFDGYVSKPFTRESLLKEISRVTMLPVALQYSSPIE